MQKTEDQSTYNQRVYESQAAVRGFEQPDLQKPEATILEEIKGELQGKKMLDIGVGTGRTTIFFAPLVSEYIGVDYSAGMIKVCNERKSDFPPNTSFAVCDATDMQMYAENSFDFILFSYNGIDSLNPEKRERVFEEVKRIGKPGSLFCYSTHNLRGMHKMFTIHPHRNPRRFYISVRRYLLTRLANGSYEKLLKNDFAIVNEAALFIKLQHYYVKPEYEAKRLRERGFTDIALYSLDGQKLREDEWSDCKTNWVYYVGRVV